MIGLGELQEAMIRTTPDQITYPRCGAEKPQLANMRSSPDRASRRFYLAHSDVRRIYRRFFAPSDPGCLGIVRS
jgi:hypothetical protein